MGLPKEKFPRTLLIDSSALDEASTRIDEAFKKAYANEIEKFRHEYANQHGAGSADNLTSADILREVVNTVGKPGKLVVTKPQKSNYWIPAANNLKTYGTWDILEVRDIDQLETAINQWIKKQ